MSLPKRISYYPSTMLDALDTASKLGELVIPCPDGLKQARGLALKFQGLRGALVAEKQPERADHIGFYVQQEPPALVLRLKEKSPLAMLVQSAIDAKAPLKSETEKIESALSRILGNSLS